MCEIVIRQIFINIFICLGSLLLSMQSVFATDYYFSSSSGNDNYTFDESQSSLTPWNSIEKLNEISNSLKPGDRIFFKRGDVFKGTIRLTKGGLPGNPIVFDAFGTGEMPVITSLVNIETWEHVGNGIYASNISDFRPTKLKIVLLDDQVREIGRYPNSDQENSGYSTIKSLNSQFSIVGNDIPFNTKGGEIVIRKNHWIIDSYPIKQSTGGTIDFWNQGTSTYKSIKGFGYFIQNHVGVLDQFGEWSYSVDQKILSVYFGDRPPSQIKVEVAVSDYLLVTNLLVKHLYFKNMHFKGANRNLVNIEQSSNVVIDDCLLEYAGENAVYSYSTPDFTIKNSQIRYALSGAIFFWHGTPRALITENLIEHTMPFQGMAKNSDLNGIGIYLAGDSDDSRIEKNKIISSGYNGIHFGGNNSIVKNNLVDKFCLWKQDGAGIYMNSDGLIDINNSGREIEGNIVLNGVGASDGTNEDYNIAAGIYLDDNTKGVKVCQNTVAHINGKGLYLHNANTIEIVDNLIFDCEVQLNLAHDNLGNPIRDVKIENNQFSSTRDRETLIAIFSINTDIDKMGFSSNNYFLNPYSRESLFETKDPEFPSGKMRNFEDWSQTYGFDETSKEQKFNLNRYKIVREEIVKRIDFNEDVKSISGTYNAISNWVGSGTNGALKVTSNSSKAGLIYIQIGKILAEETILVELEVQSENDNQTGEIFLEKTFNVNQALAVSYFNSSKKRKTVSVFLKSMTDSNEESIVFRIPSDIKGFVMDNIKVSKVTREENADQFFFRYNFSENVVNLPLIGIFKDVKGRTHKDSVAINPYQSVLLVETN